MTRDTTSDRNPEPWETSAAAAFLVLDQPQGVVAVWALGGDRFAVEGHEHKRVVAGYDAARDAAHMLARQLD